MMWNILDDPALVSLTDFSVNSTLDPVDTEHKPVNNFDRAQYERCKYLVW